MTDVFYLRPAEDADVPAVAALVERVFAVAVAPDYGPEGQAEFRRYAAPAAIGERLRAYSRITLAEGPGGTVVGMIEVRPPSHITLFFVREDWQRRGVGRALIAAAREDARTRHPRTRTMTVNSSPIALPAYVRLGFTATGPETEKNGIRFTPMHMRLR